MMNLRPGFLSTLAATLLTASAQFATAQSVAVPKALAQGIAPLAAVEKVPMPEVDNAALLSKALVLDEAGPFHFAEAIPVSLSPYDSGTWEWLADGSAVWRLRVASKGAESINLGFGRYAMPEGGRMFLYSADYSTVLGPFTEADNEKHGQLWTPLIESDEIVVEITVPGEKAAEVDVILTSVNHGYRKVGGYLEKSGSCNVDTVCSQGDDWRDQIQSVAVYGTSGTTFCTGALVNNTAQDGKPYFLTAYHCEVDATDAPSIVVYWNYENSTCRTPGSTASSQTGDGSFNQFNTGSILRAAYSASDMTLLELDDPVDPAYDPYWAGWDRTGANATSAVAIHHPNTEEKRISFEYDSTTITSYLQSSVPGDSTHIRVADWDLGTTEPGSSGSPLFDQNKRIIGQLHGGYAACGNDESDWYGRLFISWTGGGTSATRLSDWLDPLGTGVTTLDGRGTSDFLSGGAILIDDTLGTGDGDGIAERGEDTIRLTIPIQNISTGTRTGVSAVLTTTTLGVTIVSDTASYGTLAPDETASNAVPFTISIGSEVPCGTQIALNLTVSSAEAQGAFAEILPTGPNCDVLSELASGGAPVLDDTTGNGNSNGLPDPGETALHLTLPLTNTGGLAVAPSATLESLTDTASVLVGTRSWPNIANGATASNADPFVLAIATEHPCGDPIDLRLTVQGTGETIVLTYRLETGAFDPNQTGTITTSVTPGTEFGVTAETVTETITVTGEGTVLDVNLTVNMAHTWDEDLDIYLISPAGTEAHLFNRLGSSGDNLTDTVFDDEAGTAIGSGSPPFTGSFRPYQPLSVFDGEPIAGDWKVRIVDNANLDSGTVNLLKLDIEAGVIVCEPAVGAIKPGDTSGNGTITPQDAQDAFMCYLLGTCEPGKQASAADIWPDDGDGCVDANDGDGAITPSDAQRIFDRAIGVLNSCP
ncbi:MAG: lysyl endopeptidase [Candidatus Sumerlaeota bacterium]|nr:lysyl endopeptidase [Candidatus Sumerlaeota bacterium]